MEFPYYGTRRVSLHLKREGHEVGRALARSLMAAVNWRTVYPGPRTSKPQPGHRIYPYLLGGLEHIQPGGGDLRRHHLRSGARRVSVPGGDHGLGEPVRAGMGAGQHAGGGILRERARRGAGTV